MRILLTRPVPGLYASAARLRRRGFLPVACPALRLVMRRAAMPPIPRSAALAFTSANAVRAFCALGPPDTAFATPVFAVGSATARAARRAGFGHVHVGAHDVAGLVPKILVANPQHVLHFVGAAGAQNLKRRLAQHGIAVSTHILYDAQPHARLPQRLGQVFDSDSDAVMAVLFYSAASARAFLQAVPADLNQRVKRVPAFCLSAPAAKVCATHMRTHVAAVPTEDALFALLAQRLAKG